MSTAQLASGGEVTLMIAAAPPPILIHSLAHARAALAAAAEFATPVALASTPGAAGYAGPAWFEQIVATAAAEFPTATFTAVLDCGDAPGHVLAAVRWLGEPGRAKVTLRFSGAAETAQKLREIAEAAGLTLIGESNAPALDLRAARDPNAACRTWLANASPGATSGG